MVDEHITDCDMFRISSRVNLMRLLDTHRANRRNLFWPGSIPELGNQGIDAYGLLFKAHQQTA